MLAGSYKPDEVSLQAYLLCSVGGFSKDGFAEAFVLCDKMSRLP
jgi:hypothetical protein